MIVAIDAGNTRIKWGIYDGAWLGQGAASHEAMADLEAAVAACPALRQAVVSCVAGAEVESGIRLVLDRRGIETRWVGARSAACGVSNGYAQPAQLGSDRWAALVAAWQLKKSACVVASAGTALTVDVLTSGGEFLGGLIVPGFAMMQRALGADTAGIGSVEGEFRQFPACTGDAVVSGALQAMAGAVNRMQAALAQRESVAPALLLAGGDAPCLQQALSGAGEIVDNLVLEGLVLIAGERAE